MAGLVVFGPLAEGAVGGVTATTSHRSNLTSDLDAIGDRVSHVTETAHP
jgi:hypothetical protein